MPAAMSAASTSPALSPDLSVLQPALDVMRRFPCKEPPPPATASEAEPSDFQGQIMSEDLQFGLLKAPDRTAADLFAMTDADMLAMRLECARFGLLCFRGVQDMTAESFGTFMAKWGPIDRDYKPTDLDPTAPSDVAPSILGNGGEGETLLVSPMWHFDGDTAPCLHRYTSLFCVKPPFVGHPTGFAAANRAVGHLPSELLAWLEGAFAQYSECEIVEAENPDHAASTDDYGPQLKPILRRHKEFGTLLPPALVIYGKRERILLRDGTVLDKESSRALSDALEAFVTQPCFQYMMPWEANTLLVWDDQVLLHAVVPYDTNAFRRKMWRLTIREKEEMPVPPLVARAQQGTSQ